MKRKDTKQYQTLVIDKIKVLKRDNKRVFFTKSHYIYGWDIYQKIKDKEVWVFSAQNLDLVHTYLCVIYNFLQTEKMAKSKTKFKWNGHKWTVLK